MKSEAVRMSWGQNRSRYSQNGSEEELRNWRIPTYVEYTAMKYIPERDCIERGAIEIMVRRKFDFLKHSMKLAPSVSRRTSSSVITIVAMRFSTSSAEYPRALRAFAALASFPLLSSHQGDLGSGQSYS